jgi:hypothetical protein
MAHRAPTPDNRQNGLATAIRHAGAVPLLSRTNVMRTLLLIIVALLLISALPMWPYSSGWGFYPSGGLGLLLVVIIVLALTGIL